MVADSYIQVKGWGLLLRILACALETLSEAGSGKVYVGTAALGCPAGQRPAKVNPHLP
jgi:hypothetical protein